VIFFGVAPPTEAAAVGAFAATLLVAAYRKLSLQVLKEVTTEVLRIVGLIALVVMMALVFVAVFIGAGGGDVAKEVILSAPGGRWGSFAVIMLMVFLLGFVMDWIGIVFLLVPIVTPIGIALGFDPLWFAMMICVNFQMAFMTPPFAPGIFWVQGTAPKELGIALGDIIRGVLPFVVLILIGLGLLIAFPEIILWLPGKMIR
jgi:TRAP-type mannitol/chloroaromatic compound transport system permease large subunit